MLFIRYYRCISAAIEPDRISLLLLNILSLAGKQQQKTNNLRSWRAKFLPSVWFKTEMLRCLQRISPIYASSNDEKSMMQNLLSHPEHKENIQKPDAKSRNSPGQCLGITQDFRTTVHNVASHKVSHKRSWQCSLLLRWEWTDRHSPLDVCLLVLIKKRRARKSIQSCSWSSTNHKNSSLQLSQIDSHLCAVTGFPHPDLHKGEREGQGGKCWGEKGEKSHSNMQPNNSRCSDLTIRISVTQAAQINHLNPFSLPPLGICNLCRKSSNTSDFTNLTFHSNQSSRIIAFMAMLGKSKVCSCYSS